MMTAKRIEELWTRPWLMAPRALESQVRMQQSALAGQLEGSANEALRKDAKLGVDEDYWGDPLPKPYDAGDARVIPLVGTMGRGLGRLDRAFGWTDSDQVAGWMTEAAADPAVRGIVLAVDSPGGMAIGTPELGAAVLAAAAVKRVVAHVFTMAASAAYYAASAASEIIVEPSAEVGYIGTYAAFYDLSGRYESAGVKVDVIRGGKFKGQGYPGTSISEEYRALLQAEIDELTEQFRAWVKSNRGEIDLDAMQGQGHQAARAIELGLADYTGNLAAAIRRALK